MLFTDLSRLASDNPINDWEEIYSYAEKIGKGGRGYEFLSNDIPYYNVVRKKYLGQLFKDGVVIIPRYQMNQYLKNGKLPKINFMVDYSKLNNKKVFTECCRDIEVHNGIQYPNCFEKYQYSFGKISLLWKKDELEVYIEYSLFNPDGIGYKKVDGVETPLEIPQFVSERLYKIAKPIPKKNADSLKHRIKYLNSQ